MHSYRLLALVWFILGSATLCLADVRAAPYEVIFYYLAYKAEYQYRNGDLTQMVMGPKCRPASGNGPCNFNEFVNKVYTQKGTYNTADGFDLDKALTTKPPPTIHDLAQALVDKGFQSASGSIKWDAEQLIKGAQHGENMDSMIARIEKLFETMEHNNLPNLDQLQAALSGIKEERTASNAEGIYKQLEDFMGKRRKTIVPKTEKTALGHEFRRYDVDATAKIAKNDNDARKTDQLAQGKLRQLTSNSSANKHEKLLVSVDSISNTITTWRQGGCA